MNLSSKDIAALPERARRAIQAARAKPTRYPVPPVAAKPRRRKAGDGQSGLEKKLFALWCGAGGERPETQWRFNPQRRWRLDFAWPAVRVGCEAHGSTWTQGRHTRGKGFAADREKMNNAQRMGWVVFELTAQQITYDACEQIAEAIFTRRLAQNG